ncbi:predicted protein [Nematostella vectensis]|uniref:gamma-glutamylcyclotransferase n=1 Tax=Nematostella vectensis TaxID=45351 RepID=A7RWC3_NEMVE|nr:predicted protein [Nematostella vectensis]|eukprot:XP_001636299.1 predicted protein [Nematostella vectensis]
MRSHYQLVLGPRVVQKSKRPSVYFQESFSRIGSSSQRPESSTELLRAESSAHCTSRASSETYTEDGQSLAESENNGLIDRWVQDAYCGDKAVDYDNEFVVPMNSKMNILDNRNVLEISKNTSNSANKSFEDSVKTEKDSIGTKHGEYSCSKKTSFNSSKFKTVDGCGKAGTEGGNPNDDIERTSSQGLCLSVEAASLREKPVDCKDCRERTTDKAMVPSDGHFSRLDYCNGGDGVLMSVHVRRKEMAPSNDEEKDHECQQDGFSTGSLGGDDPEKCGVNGGDPCDDSDLESVDSDRIPVEKILANLDKLNLSMSAFDIIGSKHETFSSKIRRVQSAGTKRSKENPTGARNEPKPRPASSKGTMNTQKRPSSYKGDRNKSKRPASSTKTETSSRPVSSKISEPLDKTLIMRNYLSQEDERFAESLRANLPGYFTEQYLLLQRGNSETNSESDELTLANITAGENSQKDDKEITPTKAKGKFDLQEKFPVIDRRLNSPDLKHPSVSETTSCPSIDDPDGPLSGHTRPFSSMEPLSDPSAGVFFTCQVKDSAFGEGTVTDTMDTVSDVSSYHDDGFHDEADAGFEEGVSNEKHYSEHRGDADVELEVIAKAKQLIEARPRPQHVPAPLCFTINAAPPKGFLYYFAYGVDMNINRMSIYLRREHKRLWGVLFGFRLRFNKKGASKEAGGFPNIEYCPGYSVEGCLYTITQAEIAMLDNCMGFPKFYTRIVVPVWMANSYQPSELGVAQYCVPAVAYVAEQDWVETDAPEQLDCTYSLGQCLKASDLLTPNYMQYLQHLGDAR